MNDDSLRTPAVLPPTVFGELTKSWGWLLAFGIVSILLGTFGLGMTFLLTQVSVLFFGALLVVAGALQLINSIRCRGWKSTAWHVLIALLYVGAGLAILLAPAVAAISLTLVLASALIAIGILRIVMAFQVRPASGWYWPLIAGLVSAVLGGLILAQWPASGLWVIGLFIAIELIFNGWSYVFIALAARGEARRRGGGAGASGGAQPV